MNNDIAKMIEEAPRGQIYSHVIGEVEKVLIEKSLSLSFGNQSIAAKLLGINRNTFRAKMEKCDINSEKYKI